MTMNCLTQHMLALLLLSMTVDTTTSRRFSRDCAFCETKTKPSMIIGRRGRDGQLPSSSSQQQGYFHHHLPTTTILFALDQSLISKASDPLLWETLRDKEAQPVLNLSRLRSMQTAIPTDAFEQNVDVPQQENATWVDGDRWKCTLEALQEVLDGPPTGDHFLMGCPQLVRLDTKQVLESASFLFETFDESSGSTNKETASTVEGGSCATLLLVESQPKLLAYPKSILDDGLDFLTTMMSLKTRDNMVKTLIQNGQSNRMSTSAKLLLWGIESGLQTTAVQSALGAANDATSRANKRMAVDTAASLELVKKKKKGS